VKPSNSLSGLASIIIPGCKPLELIRSCITALGRYTRQPWELIVVDDGSSEETSAYLESVRDAAAVPVTVIASVTSRGHPAAINQGLKAARGEYLVLLNNDVVVNDGWLGQLIALTNAKGDFTAECADCAETDAEGGTEGRPAVDLGAGSGDPRTAPERDLRTGRGSSASPSDGLVISCAETTPAPSDSTVIGCAETTPAPSDSTVIGCAETTPPGPPFARGGKGSVGVDAHCLLPTQRTIGLVGPMSNQGAAPQCVGNVPYRDLPSTHDFARRWRDEHRGTWFTVAKLSGACILIKRAVYEAIGGLDERSGTEAWADDLAVRVQWAGFALAVAHDLFVHQRGDSAAAWARVASSWDQVPGFFDFAAVYDAAVAAGKDGDVFVEVGCLAGRSTCYLATRIRESGKAITLYAIDPSTGSPSDSTGRAERTCTGLRGRLRGHAQRRQS
jgi:GT2 family glycosyltransferase